MATFVMAASHRAREKLVGRSSARPCWFVSLDSPRQPKHRGIYEIPDDDLARALSITGVRRCTVPREYLMRCW
jgi:hypothetical protein